jgi:hypothetical protein
MKSKVPPPPSPLDPREYRSWALGIVRLNEAARELGIHPETLKRKAQRGEIEIMSIGLRACGVRRFHVYGLPDPRGENAA